MPYHFTKNTLNTNSASAVTPSVDIRSESCIAWAIKQLTGNSAKAVIDLQVSFDNILFESFYKFRPSEKTGQLANLAFGYVRFECLQAEGEVSTVDITISAK